MEEPNVPQEGAPDPLAPGCRPWPADEVQTRLEERLRTTDLGAVLAARGVTTVALNEQGELTEYRPDGTRLRLT
jgi:hypothetical protein